MGDHVSSSAPLLYGVPLGSILSPILFSLYMLPLGQIISYFGCMSCHCYVDDTQLYFPVKPNDFSNLATLHNCLATIKNWMSLSFLQLNFDKTKLLIIGPENTTNGIFPCTSPLAPYIKPNLNLGIIFDPRLKFEHLVNRLVQSCFFPLRSVPKTKPLLSSSDLESIIHTFIFSLLNF